ncbi:MobF family relaxase [Nocardia sp. NPDC003482]
MVTATLHKVLAGNGYLYYLRQVAAADSTDLGTDALADYYSAHGEAPGRWHGAGLAALELDPGDQVTEAQMRALFGEGRHPDADAIQSRVLDAEIAAGAKPKDARRAADQATRLGNPFRVYSGDNEFRIRCAEAFRAHNSELGFEAGAAIGEDVRARIRTEVAREMFTENYKRGPLDVRELSGWVAQISRPVSAAVAGFDITMSPVKSVSALWAVAPKAVADRIAAAHEAAVDDAIGWLETHGIYTRLGRNGVRQVDVDGVVAARFFHRESRCGDPDLHTHMLIANRVRAADGRWRTLDASVIYRLVVAVSEIYNTRLEHHLSAEVGVAFAPRPGTDPTKRPIREIVGVPVALIEHWSRRDAAITARLGDLAATFQRRCGREPTPKEMWELRERATLDTRPVKHLLRSLAEQRAAWRTAAETVLGSRKAVKHMLVQVFGQPAPVWPDTDSAWIAGMAERVVATVSGERATWRTHHIRAETERQVRGLLPPERWSEVTEAVVAEALSPAYSIARGDPDVAAEPALAQVAPLFARADGTSVYSGAGDQSYTSAHRLEVASRLIELSLEHGARVLADHVVDAAIARYNSDPAHAQRQLNAGQVAVVRGFATSPWRIETANAPAGSGKTTAMRVLVDAWRASGGTVLGLAPTAAAAAVLTEATGARAETVDKLLTLIDDHSPRPARPRPSSDPDREPSLPQWVLQIGADTVVIVDEHVRLGDDKRLRLFAFLAARGATIRCVGDDKQLPSIEAGGTAADTADADRAFTLGHVVRFADRAEASASLLLRTGDPAGLGYYLDHHRVHAGAHAAVHDDAYTGWIADHTDGRDTILLAPTHDLVTELNDRARADRLARTATGPETELADELSASAGDIIVTRRNDPRLRVGERDWVRNGYRWVVESVHADGSITATHLHPGRRLGDRVVLPAAYVGEHVRLGYAMTIDSAQGVTTDTCHIVLTGHESRNQLYVAITRGITANHLYVPTALDGSEASFWTEPGLMPRTAVEVLQHVLARDASQISAHTELRDALDPHHRLGRAVDIHLDAIGVAAEDALGADTLTHLDHTAEHLHPGLTDAPAWPVLRQHLATIALSGGDPITDLAAAIAERELDTAKDPAAVLDWRLDPTGAHSTGRGPLPWIRGLPDQLPDTLVTEQLRARARIIATLAEQISAEASGWTAATAPPWARPLLDTGELVAELAVWRAAHHVPDTDPRPTGPTRYPVLERCHQQLLDTRIADTLGDPHAAVHTWSALAEHINSRLLTDPWWPVLAEHLDTATRAGIDIDTLLPDAAGVRPLPDDMPAAALWFRLNLDFSTLTTPTRRDLTPDWSPHLGALVGDDALTHILADPAWPRLVAAVDHATTVGWTPHDILATAHELLATAHPDPTTAPPPDQLATALAWRIAALLNPTHQPESPTTMNTTPHPHPEPPTPHNDVPIPKPEPSQHIRGIAALFTSGHIDRAVTEFRRFTRELDDTERDILEQVATILYSRAFPVARARLRWLADRNPHHRDLIHACTPDEDPRVYRPDSNGRAPTYQRDRRHEAAHDHRQHTDPTRRNNAPTPDRGRDFTDTYLADRAPIDDDPHHLPIPEGIDHHYTKTKPRSEDLDGYRVDYDRAAIGNNHGFGCLHCGIERTAYDTTPTNGRRSDDGLCGECRDTGHPPIPDHDPAEHITARCHHITTTYPVPSAHAKLRNDWRRAPTRRARHTIADWVRNHPFPHTTTPDTTLTFDPNDPIQALTDQQLSQHINDTQRRIDLQDTEATLFGPAPQHRNTETERPTITRGWLRSELADLRAEQHRRTELTPEQEATEHRLRQHHSPDTDDHRGYRAPAAPEVAEDNDHGL